MWTVSSVCVSFSSDFYFIIAILVPLKSSLLPSIFPLITSVSLSGFFSPRSALLKSPCHLAYFFDIAGTVLKFPSCVRKKHPVYGWLSKAHILESSWFSFPWSVIYYTAPLSFSHGESLSSKKTGCLQIFLPYML